MTDMLRDIYTINRLNTELHQVLKGSFPLVWVAGEVTNLAKPSSGHLYFSLKDRHAQIRCAIFRHKRQVLRSMPSNGEHVLVRARIALYEPRGDCQLIIEHLEPAGEGQRQRAFDALKAKLQAEGLFDVKRKQALPEYPRRIGLITSPSGAALHDILHVLGRRYPSAQVMIYPTLVQGVEAPTELQRALQCALHRADCDLLILTRGGGAQEDLVAFNDEALVRCIASAQIPLVSAVGHEIDFTLADFVADQRAPTPSAAAELVTPDQATVQRKLAGIMAQLTYRWQQGLQRHRQAIDQLAHRLQRVHPENQLRQQQQRLDEYQHRMLLLYQRHQQTEAFRLAELAQRLQAQHPKAVLRQTATQLEQMHRRLSVRMREQLRGHSTTLQQVTGQLHLLSPLATLQRGYSIVRDDAESRVIRRADQVQLGELLQVQLAEGCLAVQVDQVIK